jgi:hypothetical protein
LGWRHVSTRLLEIDRSIPLGGTVEKRTVKTFCRATKRNPPTGKDYVTRQDRQGDPPPGVDEETQRSWDALSFYDSIEGIKGQIRLVPSIGKFIARYDIPEGVGITWEETSPPGHYDIRGDAEEIAQYLVDCVAYVADE